MRTVRMLSAGTAVLTLLASCATAGGHQGSAWVPMIDQRNMDQARYATDLAECRAYADANPDADAAQASRDGAVRSGVMTGALALGATVATGGLALIPMIGGTLLTSAGGAAAFGALGGRDAANLRYRGVMTSCLQGRGYSVIG